MEAIFDFAVLNDAEAGSVLVAIRDPIVFDDSSGAIKWQTAKGSEPTLAKVVQEILHNSGAGISVRQDDPVTVTQTYKTFTIALSGAPSGGTFIIAVGHTATDGIRFNAAARDVQQAIREIGGFAVKDASVSGSAGGPYTVFLPNGLNATMIADGSGLTGSSSVYDVSLLGSPTEGTFRLEVADNATPPISFNTSADRLAAAIRAVEPFDAPAPAVTSQSSGSFHVVLPPPRGGLPVKLSASMQDAAALTGGKLIGTLRFALERMSKDGQQGISPAKLKVIRFVQGAASDGAKGLSGLILRTFGGVHIGVSAGVGVLGKVSIGDNDTLVKLLDAVAGTVAGRTSELFASQALYDLGEPRSSAKRGSAVAQRGSEAGCGSTSCAGQ